jgi:hypothetical protein
MAVAALMLASPAFSQANMPTQTLSGTVVSSTGDSLVIRTDDGTERTFKVDSQSSLPASLATGVRVSVTYHRMEGGVDHAAKVTLAGTDSTARTEPPMRTDEPARSASGELPATAGPVPQLILLGLGSLAAGLGLRRSRRQA